jgi:hypothetical protein
VQTSREISTGTMARNDDDDDDDDDDDMKKVARR